MFSIKQIISGVVVMSIFILPSCIDDPCEQPRSDELVDVRMVITLPEPIVKSTITKAYSQRNDYNTVNNLNVFVFNASGTALLGTYYFDATYTGVAPNPTVSPSLPLNNTTLSTVLTFNAIQPNSTFYLVANYGSKITNTNIITNVNDLKNLKENGGSTSPMTAMMYAKAVTTTNGPTTNMSAQLIRTMAMVTVQINGTNLKNDIGTTAADSTIKFTPRVIKLMHVPNSCVLGEDVDNVIGTNAGFIEKGDSSLVPGWGEVSAGGNPIVGGHDESGIPLFLFENKQGNKPSGSTEQYKTTTDKPNSSYLLVEGNYHLYVGGLIRMSGTIIYKFCLGNDVTTNFDVERNTHYAVTLNLSGWGGAEEDGHFRNGVINVTEPTSEVGWRVDLTLRDWGFLQDEFNFDAHEGYAELQLVGQSFSIERISGPTDMLAYLDPGNGWTMIGNSANANLDNNLLKIVIMPWRIAPGSEYPTNPPYRELVLRARHGSDPPQDVIFRQWAPIKLLENGSDDLYMERFEETGAFISGDPGNSNHTWGYPNDVLGGTYLGFTFAHGDAADGFNNTLYLYERDTQSPTTGVSINSTAAQRCLRKAGYDLNRILGAAGQNKTPVEPNERAAWYLPSKVELERVIGYVGDLDNPYEFHDPIKTTVDYWSSSTPQGIQTQTYFWNHTVVPIIHPINPITTYTLNRNDLKQVRCVYRPSKDATIWALPFNPKVYP